LPHYLQIVLQSYKLTPMFKTIWIIKLSHHQHINPFSVNLSAHSVCTVLAQLCSSEPFITVHILETPVSTDNTIYCHSQELLLLVLLPFTSFCSTVNKKTDKNSVNTWHSADSVVWNCNTERIACTLKMWLMTNHEILIIKPTRCSNFSNLFLE
jgi:hypothetical protein